MPDDRKTPPPRARSHWGDTQRAEFGSEARRTPPKGIPVEIDPEVTPPPQPPPALNELEQMDVRAQIAALQASQDENARALGRVWEQRHASGQLATIVERIDALISGSARVNAIVEELIKPGYYEMLKRLDAHEQRNHRMDLFWSEQWPKTVASLEGLTSSHARLDTAFHAHVASDLQAFDQLAKLHEALASRVYSVELAYKTSDLRMVTLERGDQDMALLSKRDKWWFAAIAGVVGFVAGFAKTAWGWLSHWLSH